jgi:flagellin
MRINTNVASLSAQANSKNTNARLTSSLEKLSTGLKINRAADDASGMAIADKLRTQANSLGQGISNANSGSALITIADKAMSEQSNILDTVKTKLLQASTSTTSAEGREAIRKDVQKLLKQLNNISEQTTYNGVNLLNKKGSDFSFQVGEKSTDTIELKTEFAVNTQGLGSSDREFANSAVIKADNGGVIAGLVIEGEAVDAKLNVKSTSGSIGVTFASSAGASVEISGNNVTQLGGGGAGMIIKTNNAEDIAFLNSQAADTSDGFKKIADGIYSLTAASKTFSNNATHTFEALTVSVGSVGSAFTLTGSSDSTIKKVSGTADITINNAIDVVVDGDSADGIAFGDQIMVTEGTLAIKADNTITNGAVAINTVKAATAASVAELELSIASEDTVQSISLWNSAGSSMVVLSTTDGETAKALEDAGLTKSQDGTYIWKAKSSSSNKLNFGGDGIVISNLTVEGLSKTTSSTERLYVETKGAVTVENLIEATGNTKDLQNGVGVQVSTFNDNGASAATVATAFSASTVSSGLGASQLSGLLSLGEGKLTADTASNFMSVIDDAMTQLNTVRSDFGSTQNQLSVATRNMMTTQVNIKAAESIIRDVDYAEESASFNKQNIIAQAGTYAMSQANAMQQNVLRLLQ